MKNASILPKANLEDNILDPVLVTGFEPMVTKVSTAPPQIKTNIRRSHSLRMQTAH